IGLSAQCGDCRDCPADAGGDKLRVTNFAPRFERFEWAFWPPQTTRIEPLAGLQRITAFGLLSEDIYRDTHELWGNLAHPCSVAGIIKLRRVCRRVGRTHGRTSHHSLQPRGGSRFAWHAIRGRDGGGGESSAEKS